MERLEESTRVRAAMSWALILIVAMLFMGSLVWGVLNPTHQRMTDMSKEMSNSSAADTGANRVALVWRMWPVWFLGAVLLWGYRRAVNESNRRTI